MVGVEHTTLYSELPEDQAQFEAQKVGLTMLFTSNCVIIDL